MKNKVCILGTLHDYQFSLPRKRYLSNVQELIRLHDVDLVAEEATGAATTYARDLVNGYRTRMNMDIEWANVDLLSEERKKVPDSNPDGAGTLVDFDLYYFREWVWVIRTTKIMTTTPRHSALLICGMAHLFSVAEKFLWTGAEVETNVYFDQEDVAKMY